MISLWIFIVAIVTCQVIIAVLYYQIGWQQFWPFLIVLLPFGIAVFGMQVFYYERHYPDWQVPFKTKLLLKYCYILTFFQFVSLYLLLFVFK